MDQEVQHLIDMAERTKADIDAMLTNRLDKENHSPTSVKCQVYNENRLYLRDSLLKLAEEVSKELKI